MQMLIKVAFYHRIEIKVAQHCNRGRKEGKKRMQRGTNRFLSHVPLCCDPGNIACLLDAGDTYVKYHFFSNCTVAKHV